MSKESMFCSDMHYTIHLRYNEMISDQQSLREIHSFHLPYSEVTPCFLHHKF